MVKVSVRVRVTIRATSRVRVKVRVNIRVIVFSGSIHWPAAGGNRVQAIEGEIMGMVKEDGETIHEIRWTSGRVGVGLGLVLELVS